VPQRTVAGVRNGRRFIAKWQRELIEYESAPTARDRDAAIATAIARAEGRTALPRPQLTPAVPQPGPPTELEALCAHSRMLEAALSLDDEIVLELLSTQDRVARLRQVASRVPLGRRLLGWAARPFNR
jgi:hypothetical protein